MRQFVRHEPVLRAYARTLLPDWNVVDDALQEASVTMWEKRSDLESASGFLPWAKVVVRFKCLSAIAAARRSRPLLTDEMLQQLADEADALQLEELASIRSAHSKCLGKFNAAHQELILAPYSESGRVQQLAGQCGKSAHALYKLLGRLRDKLADCMRGLLQVEGL
ncbi:RNA polymerase sigma factor [Thalassoglobus neptunius]|uniref:RNA polymerase sigma factor n=2 Tax=Thalassoglobus neptunius TaxID=1938619 RepID=A0A5C5VXC4_9PLAN|nr:RNA polymerase sigma factor [Thalassoglobus neptunius]